MAAVDAGERQWIPSTAVDSAYDRERVRDASEREEERRRSGGERRERREKGHWDSEENQRKFLEAFAAERNLDPSSPSAWAAVSVRELRDYGGRGLLGRHGNSVRRAVTAVFPSLRDADELQLSARKERGHWLDPANRRAFLDRIAAEKGVKSVEDWRQVTTMDVKEAGGARLLAMFNHSLHAILADAYPEENMEELLCRPRVPNGYWDSGENRRSFVDSVARAAGVQQASDWRKVSSQEVQRLGGSRLLARFNGSLADLLQDVYPELKDVSRDSFRAKAGQGHWDNRRRQRDFLDLVAKRHGIERAGDWVRIGSKEIHELGGSGLLSRYSGIFACLRSVYGDTYKGEPLTALNSASRLPVNFWRKDENVIEFIRIAEKELAIESPEEWYRVSTAQLSELRGGGLRMAMPLIEALRIAHPTVAWDDDQFAGAKGKRKKATQRALRLKLDAIFNELP
eukprot:CAMPEP_0114617818 /NCGR_PEP_ID=MMETSP0168-20121206/7390_1 /TAXON_ID=95228 ORGANISM="Vannella sp., Strain DIVA3 517/6/12" /NCGR_SAMPLE_ID=MMETSP0168 /ASSEMBLY_ACC=CAM_ASM_000044 /LENGTH=455 /DNA_ID=CAMNT_0001828959 /DNA_START=111 /DNA_END=1475 /DNA_ORIENTATION=-